MSFIECRKLSGLTQRQAAEKIGVSDAAIVQWERHGAIPRRSLLPKIAEAYGCTVTDLLMPSNQTQVTDDTHIVSTDVRFLIHNGELYVGIADVNKIVAAAMRNRVG